MRQLLCLQLINLPIGPGCSWSRLLVQPATAWTEGAVWGRACSAGGACLSHGQKVSTKESQKEERDCTCCCLPEFVPVGLCTKMCSVSDTDTPAIKVSVSCTNHAASDSAPTEAESLAMWSAQLLGTSEQPRIKTAGRHLRSFQLRLWYFGMGEKQLPENDVHSTAGWPASTSALVPKGRMRVPLLLALPFAAPYGWHHWGVR